MTGVVVSIYAADLTFIAHVPRCRNIEWTDEFNTAGAASFEIPLNDDLLIAKPQILDRRNVVVLHVGGQAVYAWQIIDLNPARVGADGEQWVKVSGLDVLNVLDAAKVGPELTPLTDHTRDTRWFDQFSLTGDWFVSADWTAPASVEQALSTTRAGYPLRWPTLFQHSKWLWSTDPDATATVGWNHFRATFTLASQQDVRIYASADNIMDLRLNGTRIYNSTDRYQFRRTVSYTINLPAGTHRIGAAVYNTGGPAGWLCAVANIDSSGNPTSAIYQSLSGNTLVHDDSPTRPGWAKAHVLKQLILEAQTRGVHELLPVTFGFTATTDSDGVAWTDLTTRSEQVEVTLVSQVAQKFVEAGLDMKITPVFTGTPGLRLDLWNSRGSDLSDTVRLLAGVTSSSPTIQSGRVRTVVTVRHDKGWAGEYTDSAAATLRREIGLTAGGLSRDSDAAVLADTYFQESASEEVTIPVQITSEAGPQPYVDFNVGDTVTTVGALSGTTTARVMSITGKAAAGFVTYDVITYPIT